MRFVQEESFDIKPGKLREFERWLLTNDDKLRLTSPRGVHFLGAYAVVHTTENATAEIRIDWGTDSYSAVTTFDEAVDELGPFGPLLEGLHGFAEEQHPHHVSRTVMRSLAPISSRGGVSTAN